MRAPTREPDFDAWFGPDAFDASYGHDLSALRAIEPPQPVPGFTAHWQARYEAARQVRPELERTPAGTACDHDVFTVQFSTTDGRRLGGWLALPRTGPVQRGVVHSHEIGRASCRARVEHG